MSAIGEPRRIRQPILILGCPRSGTTMLGNLLATHPDLAYWEEPRTVWSRGNAWLDDDRLLAEHLNPAIARHIDKRFHHFQTQGDKSRFGEKTPSNTLRLPFIHALYPDSRIIHMVRDGRAVVASMLKMLSTPPRRQRILARLRETHWRDLPAMLPLAGRELKRLRSADRQRSFWGPRPPGWEEWLDLPAPLMLTKQWCAMVKTARHDLLLFPEKQRLELRYEDLLADPARWLEEIRQLTGLRLWSEAFGASAVASISKDPAQRWRRELDAETVNMIEEEAGDILDQLGYHPIQKPC